MPPATGLQVVWSLSLAGVSPVKLCHFRARQVHKYVGCEPSGLEFNDFSFNYRNVPYNPMINTGAIVVGSCLSPGLEMHDRFKGFMDKVSGMAGGACRNATLSRCAGDISSILR